MNRRILLLSVCLSACIASPEAETEAEAGAAAEVDGGAETGEGAARCPDAIDLRTGEPRALYPGGFVVRGRGDVGFDAAGACADHAPSGRELVVELTAEVAGVHTFDAQGGPGHFYQLADDCAGPAVCAHAGAEWRRLAFDLDAGERVRLAFAAPGDADGAVAIGVAFPEEERGEPRLGNARVTAGAGVIGVIVQYDSDWGDRVAALPWIAAAVRGDDAEVRVPLTAVMGVGHGLMTAAGVAPLEVALPRAVTVQLVDERAGGDVRWGSATVDAPVDGPADVGWNSFCADGLWRCSGETVCAPSPFVSGADPGAVRRCERGGSD